jgi:hypothetical protein
MQVEPHCLCVEGLHMYEQVLEDVQVPMVPVPPEVQSELPQQPLFGTHCPVLLQYL